MVFSDSTNDTGIVQDIDFLAGSSSVSFPLKDKARLVNFYIYKAVTAKIKANKTWTFVDPNTGKTVWSFADLVADQQDYTLPTNLLQLEGVSVLNSNGDWEVLEHRPRERIIQDQTEYLETAGMPKFYNVFGHSLMLFPKPSSTDVTTSQGLKLYFSKEIDAFTASDTTQEPPLPENFHRLCSFGPAYEFLLLNGDQNKAAVLKAEFQNLLAEYVDFESDRNKEEKPRIRPAHTVRDYI